MLKDLSNCDTIVVSLVGLLTDFLVNDILKLQNTSCWHVVWSLNLRIRWVLESPNSTEHLLEVSFSVIWHRAAVIEVIIYKAVHSHAVVLNIWLNVAAEILINLLGSLLAGDNSWMHVLIAEESVL